MSENVDALLGPESAPVVPLETWKKWVPFTFDFWKYHFGSDLLIASWLFLLSSVLWVGVEADVMVSDSVHRFAVAFNHDLTLAAASAFTLGSVYFVYLSYPEELAKMQRLLSAGDPKKMSCLERYFTGSDMLIATWFFVLAMLPFVVFGVYATISDPASLVGYTKLLASSFAFAALSVWLLAALPENMAANKGRGSTKVYDAYFAKGCCAGCCAETAKKFWHTDLLLGMWCVAVGAACLLPFAIYLCAAYPAEVNSWLDLLLVVAFSLGACLMAYTSYPDNAGSTLVADALACRPSRNPKGAVE